MRLHDLYVFSFLQAYGPAEWTKHKSPGRYLRHLLSLSRSRSLSNLVPPLLYSFGLTLTVGLYRTLLVPELGLPDLVTVGWSSIGVVTGAMTFLLVFRTNNSYSRYDEARKLWGGMVNRSRDIVRQSCSYFPPGPAGSADCEAMARWSTALAFSLRALWRAPSPRATGAPPPPPCRPCATPPPPLPPRPAVGLARTRWRRCGRCCGPRSWPCWRRRRTARGCACRSGILGPGFFRVQIPKPNPRACRSWES